MNRNSLFAASMGSLLSVSVASAHPGHGEPGDDFGLIHYVTEPAHITAGVALFAAAGLLFGLFLKLYLRHRSRQDSVRLATIPVEAGKQRGSRTCGMTERRR